MNETVVFDVGITITYILLGLAVLAVVVFAIFQLFANFKRAKNGLIGLGILAVILFVSYLMGSSEVYENASAQTSQWVSGGIYATVILIGLAFIAAIFTEVSKFFR